MRRRGFTLVEVMVALVVLEVGLLGVLGTLWLATSTLARAERVERGVAEVERVWDSLAAAGDAGSGMLETPAGRVRWWPRGSGLRVEWSSGPDSALVRLDARMPGSGGP
ncbi:MAG: prepilin-type N-terminal cleavage/methylation domain-containing protein [Gemmatimonadetes bacterium]|nr:prepilin-type N-terminal cleavage/methylation domain-containing protein [Gemmatimonadota bacterium]